MVHRMEVLRRIKEVISEVAIRHGIDVDKVILFGSRARGDFRENSDWDLLVITKTKYGRRVVREFLLEVRRALVDIGIVPEIIVVEKYTVEKYKKHTGYVYYHALAEGIVL